jgi:hypothetical protein
LHPLLHAGYGLPLESAIDLVFVEEKIVAHFLFLQSARVGYLPSGLFDDDPVPLQADRYFAARQAASWMRRKSHQSVMNGCHFSSMSRKAGSQNS